MKVETTVAVLTFFLFGCSVLGLDRGDGAVETKVEATETDPMTRLHERMAVQLDPARRERLLAERFPGAKTIDAVEVALWPKSRSGPCWSELERLESAGIDVSWRPRSEKTRRATSMADVVKDEWLRIYRTPAGEGIERVGPLRTLDLRLDSKLHCLCAPGDAVIVGDRLPLTLRVRWSEGKNPEISVAAVRGDKRQSLTPSVRVGRVVTWEFPVEAAFAERGHGRCGATVAVTLVIDPLFG